MSSGVNFDHFKKLKNATVFHYEGRVDIRARHLPGAIWLFQRDEKGESGTSEPLDHALLGFHGKKVKATVVIEEVD